MDIALNFSVRSLAPSLVIICFFLSTLSSLAHHNKCLPYNFAKCLRIPDQFSLGGSPPSVGDSIASPSHSRDRHKHRQMTRKKNAGEAVSTCLILQAVSDSVLGGQKKISSLCLPTPPVFDCTSKSQTFVVGCFVARIPRCHMTAIRADRAVHCIS